MTQHDMIINNSDGASVRSDINNALEAIATQNSGTSAPSTTYPGQIWWDTTNNILKIRNAANNAWLDKTKFNGTAFQRLWSKGADVASASALAIGSDGNYFDVTGTTTITSINTTGNVGTVVKLHFDDALTLTHNATDLVLPTAANITTAAGDEAEFIEYASGDWRCTSYTRASGEALVSASGGWTTISDTTITGSPTSIDVTGLIDDYASYEIELIDFQLPSDVLELTFQTQGGSFTTSLYDSYTFSGRDGGASSITGYTESNDNQISAQKGTSAIEAYFGTIRVFGARMTGSHTVVMLQLAWVDEGGTDTGQIYTMGVRESDEAIQAIKLEGSSSSVIAGGRLILRGI